MSEARDSNQAVLAERLTEFTERSQHIVQEFWRNQAADLQLGHLRALSQPPAGS